MNATAEPRTAEQERTGQTGRVTLDPEPHDEGSSQHGGGPGRPPEPPPPPGRRRPEGNNGRAWILSILLVVCLVCAIVLARMLGRSRSNDGD